MITPFTLSINFFWFKIITMALTNLLSLFLHTKFFKSVSAIKIKDGEDMYSLPEITKIWYEENPTSSDEKVSVKSGIYIEFSPMKVTTSDSADQKIEKDEFEKILNETAELTITNIAGKEKPMSIPLKLTIGYAIQDKKQILASKEELTKTVLDKITKLLEDGLFLSLSYKISDTVSVEYSCIVCDEEIQNDGTVLYYTELDDFGITPVVKISKDESVDIPLDSPEDEEYIPISFWITQAGVTFLIISIISVLFFIIPTIWRVYRILFSK